MAATTNPCEVIPTVTCSLCGGGVTHNGMTDVCSNNECKSRTARIIRHPRPEMFMLQYMHPSGVGRVQLLEAQSFIAADMEAQQLGYTIDYGVNE